MGKDFVRFTGTADYIASPALVDAVNCAIALGRPLLLKGEPGTGKTVLARHVAEALGMPMLSWHVKSTSKAADGQVRPYDRRALERRLLTGVRDDEPCQRPLPPFAAACTASSSG